MMNANIYKGFLVIKRGEEEERKKYFMFCSITNSADKSKMEEEAGRLMEEIERRVKLQGYVINSKEINEVQEFTHKRLIQMEDSYKLYFNTTRGPVDREARDLRRTILMN